jgi:hypothetical protein
MDGYSQIAFLVKHRDGTLTQDETDKALITPEELAAWGDAYDQHGLRGLQTTRVQQYRGSAGGRRVGAE